MWLYRCVPTGRQLIASVAIGSILGYVLTITIERVPGMKSLPISQAAGEKIIDSPAACSFYKECDVFSNDLCCQKQIIQTPPVLYQDKKREKMQAGTKRLAAVNPVKKKKLSVAPAPIPKRPKKPNSVVITMEQAPVTSGAIRISSGKYVCAKKNDHPRRSKKNPWGHIDLECCLDPDEIPNPRCDYNKKRP